MNALGEDFESLIQTTSRINSSDDIETMCRHIIDGAWSVLRSEAVSLMLTEETTGRLTWFAVEGEAGKLLVGHELAPGEGVAGWVARSGQTVVTNDAPRDTRFCSRIDAFSGFATHSLLCVPLVAYGRILGVLEFINHAPDHPFGKDDVRKAQAFASLAAIALENSRLIRVAEEIGNAREISRFKNDMVSVVAHEIRNPLTVIRGFAEAFSDEAVDVAKLREFARRIRDEAYRVERMIDGFLNLSRIESGQIEIREDEVALSDVLATCRERHIDGANCNEIQVSVPDSEQVNVFADRDRLEQVVDNLLSNAIKYSPEGEPISVRVERQVGEWRVSVTDQGLGIPQEYVSRVFHHFFRVPDAAHMRRPGSGLGLTIAKLLLDKMNGRIGVESDVGSGTTFWFSLPAVTEKEARNQTS